MPYGTVSPTDDFFKDIDLSQRREKILSQIFKKIDFTPEGKELWISKYWHKGVGAFSLPGIFKDKEGRKHKALLKVQGAKPKISEPEIIRRFNQQNQSKIIKVPQVLFSIPWSDDLGFEVYIFEKVEANFIISPHKKASKAQLRQFFRVYLEYKDRALQKPFLPKVKNYPPYIEKFKKWRKIRLDNPLRDFITEDEDKEIFRIVKFLNRILLKELSKENLEFQHGHLSIYDIKRANNGKYYLFSNLFWGYYYPLYDSVFAFEWFILGIAHLSKKTIEEQINLWLREIAETLQKSQYVRRVYGENYLKYHYFAVVERLLAALNLDILCINNREDILKIKPILWKYLYVYLNKLQSLINVDVGFGYS